MTMKSLEGLKSPIRWPGGKSRLVKTLIRYIPDHIIYAEPFAGAAWLYWYKPLVRVNVLNDIDPRLIRFYRELRKLENANDLKQIIKTYGWFYKVSKKTYTRRIHTAFNWLQHWRTLPSDKFIWSFLALDKFNYASKLNTIGLNYGIIQNKTSRRYSGIIYLIEHFDEIKMKLKKTKLYSTDYKKILHKFDTPRTFFYLDPPYYITKEEDAYLSNITGHTPTPEEVIKYASKLKGMVMISYAYRKSIKTFAEERGFKAKTVKVKYEMGKNLRDGKASTRRELILMNY